MRTLIALGMMLIVACASHSSRTVAGSLSAQHPGDTSALAISATSRVAAPLAADGSFSLELKGSAPYRLHFVTSRGGHPAILATAARSSDHRVLLIRPDSGNGQIQLGKIGRGDQQLAVSATGDPCTGEGDEVDVENDQGGVDAGVDVENDQVDVDGGEDGNANASDAGEQESDSHDNVCDDRDGGGDEADGGPEHHGDDDLDGGDHEDGGEDGGHD